jgi:TRAP-type transport system small permease protein
MERINAALHRVLTWLMMLTVLVLIVPVLLQIVSRFVEFVPRYIWTEELSRFLLIWMVMLGAMVAVREGTHFDVDVWTSLTDRGDTLLRIVANLGSLVLAGVFIYWGLQFVDFGWYQTSEIADLPMWTIFIAWPIAGLTWVAFGGQKLVRDLRRLRDGAPADEPADAERRLESAS